MISEYSTYKGISVEEIKSKINSSLDIDSIYSEELIFDTFKIGFNLDKQSLLSKYHAFSPQLIDFFFNLNIRSFLEIGISFGLFSDLMIEFNPNILVDYLNPNNEIKDFSKTIISKKVNIIDSIEKKYDAILCDGYVQYFSDKEQVSLITKLSDSINYNGVIGLLIDLGGKSYLREDVDINKLHSIMDDKGLVCLYGKNTFSSIWKKCI